NAVRQTIFWMPTWERGAEAAARLPGADPREPDLAGACRDGGWGTAHGLPDHLDRVQRRHARHLPVLGQRRLMRGQRLRAVRSQGGERAEPEAMTVQWGERGAGVRNRPPDETRSSKGLRGWLFCHPPSR